MYNFTSLDGVKERLQYLKEQERRIANQMVEAEIKRKAEGDAAALHFLNVTGTGAKGYIAEKKAAASAKAVTYDNVLAMLNGIHASADEDVLVSNVIPSETRAVCDVCGSVIGAAVPKDAPWAIIDADNGVVERFEEASEGVAALQSYNEEAPNKYRLEYSPLRIHPGHVGVKMEQNVQQGVESINKVFDAMEQDIKNEAEQPLAVVSQPPSAMSEADAEAAERDKLPPAARGQV